MNTIIDDYWTRQVEIGRLPLPVDCERDVSLIWHQSREQCGFDHRELGLGTFTDKTERVYVHAKACFFTPDLVLSVALSAAPGAQIGEVIGSQVRGSTRREFANLQAWYYPTARALMIWEVDLWSRYRDETPAGDFILSCLWNGFETALLREFSDAREIITPHEPDYDHEQWVAFLAACGYAPHIENTYRKFVPQEGK